MEPPVSFGYWVRRRRKALDLTQRELARVAGCALGTLKKIEADERHPSRQLAERLAAFLHIPAAERPDFLRAARGELAPDRLPAPVPGSQPSWPASQSPPHNLPVQPTALIGRERDVAAVCALLTDDGTRLVTLTGPGGVGKTRVALEAAARLLARFPDGVWFVGLAPLADPGLVPAQFARALGVAEQGGRPLLATLQDALRERRILLLLDNYEHLLAAAPLVAELLAAAAGLRVLATSREGLRLRGERELAVPPLELPAGGATTTTLAMESPAVQLFVARARDARSTFTLTDASAAAVAEICARLDGVPLALELAAARVRHASPATLLERLARPLEVLTNGARDLPPRQQAVRSTLDWSYRLLTAGEQRLLRQLGVFAGDGAVETAGAVCDVSGAGASDVEAALAALADKSLISLDWRADGVGRFQLLETVREYAVERLAEAGELDTLRRRHAEAFLALAETAEPELWGPDQVAWLERLEADHDNLRAALAWSLGDGGAPEVGARIAAALSWFWAWLGHLEEGARQVQAALEAERSPTVVRARLLYGRGLHALDSDLTPARALFEESLAIYRALGEQRGQADVLFALAELTYFQGGHTPEVDRLKRESLALFRQLGHTVGIAQVLGLTDFAEPDAASISRSP